MPLGLRSWLQRHPPPLGWWLLAPTLIILLLVFAAVSWTLYRSAQGNLQRFERQIAAEIGNGIELQLRDLADDVAETLNAGRDAMRRGMLVPERVDALLQYSANQLRHRHALNFMAFSLQDGAMAGALRLPADESLRALRVDPATGGRLALHFLSLHEDLPTELDKLGPPFDPRERPSYQRALRSLRPGWAPVQPYQSFGSLGLGMSAPLLASDGSGLQGVVSVGVTLTQVSRFLASRFDAGGQSRGLAFVAEVDGQLLGSSLPEALARLDNNASAERRGFADMKDARLRALGDWFKADAGQHLLRIEGVGYVLDLRRLQLPGGLEVVLGVLFEERELLGAVWEQARSTAVWVGLMLLAGLLLLGLLLRLLQRRVQAISDAALRLADGDRSARAPEQTAVAELQTLASSFNRMSCQVEAAISGLEAEVASRTAELEAANGELQRLVALDGLTQIANRRHFDEQLRLAWRRCQREQRPLALLMVDVDDFKAYNDHYGHPAGDEVLRQVARVLAAAQRRSDDLAARYGGEEFVLMLPGADAAAALQAAEQLLAALRALALPHEKARAAAIVTASIGVASSVPAPGHEAQALLAAADAALYAAKDGGRNRVAAAGISHDEK